jgi:hypothetical protein
MDAEDGDNVLPDGASRGGADDRTVDFNEKASIQELQFWWSMPDIMSEKIMTYLDPLNELPFSKRGKEEIIQIGLDLATRHQMRDLMHLCLVNIPENVEWSTLAYGLACVYARENDKPNILKYAKLAALDNEKYNPRKFLDDLNFDPYFEDPEFLEAIGEITDREKIKRLSGKGVENPVSLNSILSELSDPNIRVRDASSQLERAYSSDPDAFAAVLNGNDVFRKLILASWFAGRDPTDENIDRAMDASADVFFEIAGEYRLNETLRVLEHYLHIPGIGRFISALRSMKNDQASDTKEDRLENAETVAKDAVALAGETVPALYRIYSSAYFLPRYKYNAERREELHPHFMRCRDVFPSILKFSITHPWVGREDDLLDMAGDAEDEGTDELDRIILSNADAASDTVKELMSLGDSVRHGDRRFFIAWRLLENGLGTDLLDMITSSLRTIISKDLGCGPQQENAGENSKRLVDWIFGDLECDVRDILPEKRSYIYSSIEAV